MSIASLTWRFKTKTSIRSTQLQYLINVMVLMAISAGVLLSASTARRPVIGYHVCNWGENWHSVDGYTHYQWDALTEMSYASAAFVAPNGTVVLGCIDPLQKERDAEYTIIHGLARANGVRVTQSVGLTGLSVFLMQCVRWQCVCAVGLTGLSVFHSPILMQRVHWQCVWVPLSSPVCLPFTHPFCAFLLISLRLFQCVR